MHDGGMNDEDLFFTSRSVKSVASDRVTTIDPGATLSEAAALLAKEGVSLLVVGKGDDVEGVVSEHDIVRAVADGVDLDTATVASIESSHLRWATIDSTIAEVASEMMENYIRHVLVRDDSGALYGIVSMRDLLVELLD
jgi:CBS domain-containing protein